MTDAQVQILAVDDNATTREVIQRLLQGAGYRVFTAADITAAATFLKTNPVDLVITDLKMPGGSGQELIRHVHENHPATAVMMITGYPSIPGAVDAVRQGAEEYLAKPFTDTELLAAVHRVLQRAAHRRAVAVPPAPATAGELLGASPVMARLRAAISRAAAADATVLITGESGTGKELIARAIHYRSARANAPFITVNCSAIPGALLESELFGHRRGAFTGAHSDRAGFFRAAEGGTLFLDEIGDTPPAMQASLLRVLQNGEIVTIGDDHAQHVNVRVIAATNQQLSAADARRQFREDLYYRLAVITLVAPPLRKRGDDVLLLATGFLARYAHTRRSAGARVQRRHHRRPARLRLARQCARTGESHAPAGRHA